MKNTLILVFLFSLLGCGIDHEKTEPIFDFPSSIEKGDVNTLVPKWDIVSKAWGYLDPANGEMVLDPRFDHAGAFQNKIAYAITLKEDSYTVILYRLSSQGEASPIIEVPFENSRPGRFSILPSGLITHRDSNGHTIFSRDGRELIQVPKSNTGISIHALGNVGLAALIEKEWVFLCSDEKVSSRISSDDFTLAFGLENSRNSKDYLNGIRMKSNATQKWGMIDFKGQTIIDCRYEEVSLVSTDSIYWGIENGRYSVMRLSDNRKTFLPDSLIPLSPIRGYFKEQNLILVENEPLQSDKELYSYQLDSGTIHKLPSTWCARLSDSLLAIKTNNKMDLIGPRGRQEMNIPKSFNETPLNTIIEKANGFLFHEIANGDLHGAISEKAEIIVLPTFDKIDIGASPYRADFPYIVAERDSGSFKEVYLFGIEGDTLAGPMRLTAWERGSAYNHLRHRRHVLNHSNWRGTPKEEMLFYVEWEDSGSVTHKGYIDFFGHLYE